MNEIFIAYILGVLTFPAILGIPRLMKLLMKTRESYNSIRKKIDNVVS